VQTLSSAREAKEFLVERIVSQAQHDGVGLSDIERKMLYFSETGWTLPDMAEIAARFEREYESGEFERKIGGIARNIQRARARDKDEESKWNKAVALLSTEDTISLF
jgi:negative regulator of replication initiation